MSYHDALTALPNRRLFNDRLQQMLLMSQRQHQSLVLLIFDLNGFKKVNDVYGHPCGDLILRQVSFRVSKAIRESDTLARLGGDEFGVILPNTNLPGAAVVIRDVLNCFDEPMVAGGRAIPMDISIGIALGDETINPEALERQADDAMYRAKRTKQRLSIYRIPRSSSGKILEEPSILNSRRQKIRAKRTHIS